LNCQQLQHGEIMKVSRRNFLTSAALSSAAVALGASANAQNENQNSNPKPDPATPGQMDHSKMGSMNHPKPERPVVPRLPALICTMTNTSSVDAAYQMLKQNSDTLDAALHLTSTQENDPDDYSTGLGGLPNEDCEVQLDACVLHGPTRRSAAVASVSGIKNPSLLARAILQHTGYSLLSSADAQRFGLTHGFTKEELLTDRTRKQFAVWKQMQSAPPQLESAIYDPSWPQPASKAHFLTRNQKDLDTLVHNMEPIAEKAGLGPQYTWRAAYDALFPAAEPLYVGTVNQNKELSSAATTSGVPWRMPGATGDIAIIGAGTYLDPEVGSAGSSGNADTNIKISGARLIVENMRKGMSPEDAGMDVLERIAHWYENDMSALRFVEMVYYILRKDGAYGSVSLWHGDRTGHVREFTIHDGIRRSEECRFLLEGNPPNGCGKCIHAPTPSMLSM
jgi:N4-(beta-N-acetylglucosaminyl)-L-asparaginase